MSNDDLDLDALLESALEDFNSEPEIPVTRSSPSSSSSQINSNHNDNINIPSSNSVPNSPFKGDDEFAELLKDPMKALTNLLSDPKMKEEFEKDFGGLMSGMTGDTQGFSLDNLQKELENLTKDIPDEIKQNETPIKETKPTQSSQQSSPQQDNLQSTLENLMNNAKDLQDSDDFGEENIMNLFKDLENNPEVQNMMESMMEKFMSKEVLYEGLTELQVKFQEWLNKKEKEGTLSEEDITKYKLQIDSISRVLAIYDANENDENTTIEAEKLMKQMETVGTLPEEVLAEIGKPGLGDAPCTIM